MAFVALGGEGKTALVAKWAVGMAEKGWPDAKAAFGWSFYSQGSSEQQASSSDLFLAEALKFFGAPAIEGVRARTTRAAASPPGSATSAPCSSSMASSRCNIRRPRRLPGQLKDEGLSALLKGLAQSNKGLCLVTTRYPIKDIEAYSATAPQEDLAPLVEGSGRAACWKRSASTGRAAEREQLSADVRGHALTLNLIGSYLRDAHGGDIRQRDRIKLEEADDEEQGGHAFRVMDAYAEWFESDGERGPQRAGDAAAPRPVRPTSRCRCLAALWNGQRSTG